MNLIFGFFLPYSLVKLFCFNNLSNDVEFKCVKDWYNIIASDKIARMLRCRRHGGVFSVLAK